MCLNLGKLINDPNVFIAFRDNGDCKKQTLDYVLLTIIDLQIN